MKSLTKTLVSILGGIGALAGFTLFANSCDDNDADSVVTYYGPPPVNCQAVKDPCQYPTCQESMPECTVDPKIDCNTVADPCQYAQCANASQCLAYYGPPAVDCDNVKDPCEYAECQDKCVMADYGPPSVDPADCDKFDDPCAYLECRGTEACPSTVYGPAPSCESINDCDKEECKGADICVNPEKIDCDEVNDPCSLPQCQDKCMTYYGPDPAINCQSSKDCSKDECKDLPMCQVAVYGPPAIDCDKVEDPCKYDECMNNAACMQVVYGPAPISEKEIEECCGKNDKSEKFNKCVANYTSTGKCPQDA